MRSTYSSGFFYLHIEKDKKDHYYQHRIIKFLGVNKSIIDHRDKSNTKKNFINGIVSFALSENANND